MRRIGCNGQVGRQLLRSQCCFFSHLPQRESEKKQRMYCEVVQFCQSHGYTAGSFQQALLKKRGAGGRMKARDA